MSAIERRALLLGLGGVAASAFAGCRAARDERTLDLWFSYGGNNRKVLLELVERFHAAQDEVRVHAVYQGDYFEALAKLRTAVYAGATPAVTHVVGEVLPYLVRAGALEPLGEVGAAIDADVLPALGQAGSFEGGPSELYALPFNRSVPIAYCNADLFRALGLSPPTTWDELVATARAAQVVDASGEVARWGFECPIDWWFWNALVGQAGGRLADETGAVDLGGDAAVQAIELWQRLVHEEHTMKPPAGRDFNAWEVTNTDFLAQRVAMIWTSTAFIRYLEDNASFEVRAVPLPRGVRASVPTGGTFWVLPRERLGEPLAPARKRAALAFLRFVSEPEQANHWATSTGYLPTSQRGLALLDAAGFFAAHPNHRAAIDSLAAARPWPWLPALFRVQRELIQPRLEDAVLNRRDARALLAEIRELAREL